MRDLILSGGFLLTGLTFAGPAIPGARAAEVDVTSLPPPADRTVDFARDIRPIFEQACFRCHGPERPKSGFRLDTREAALRGGSQGRAILPGQSTNSPLVHYVARLVPDLEMPPVGKGEALTREQVALLRAWIDQGAVWAEAAPPRHQVTLAPGFGWLWVDGDAQKFREHHRQPEGWQGGLTEFDWKERLGEQGRLNLSGHVRRDDYAVRVSLDRKDWGFVRGGFEQFREYYDSTGGFYEPFVPPTFDLPRGLSLDLGRAWIEAGRYVPDQPRFTVGYEYRSRQGDKSMLNWLPATQRGVTRNLLPTAKHVDEHAHLVRLDVAHRVAGLEIEDNARLEFYDLSTDRVSVRPFPVNSSGSFVQTLESHDHWRVANTLLVSKQPKEWLFASVGYLYSRLDGAASLRQQTLDASGVPTFGHYWSGHDITLDQQSHVVSASTQLGPWQGLAFSVAVQPEWSWQRGFGHVRLDEGLPPLTGTEVRPATLDADLDRVLVEEHVGLRYTLVPSTTLFAEARLRQDRLSQFEEKQGAGFSSVPNFLRDTEAATDAQEYRAGFYTSPWNRLSLGAHYRRRIKASDYDHRRDPTAGGYSAFITGQDTDTDEVSAKLTVRPQTWLSLTLTYQLQATDYETATLPSAFSPGGHVSNAGNYDAHIYSVNVAVTPFRRLYLSATCSHTDSRITTFAQNSSAIVPYRGGSYAVLGSATFAWTEKTDLVARYTFSTADYEQDFATTGLPLGLRYRQHALLAGVKHRLTTNLTTLLQYGFFDYAEPSTNHSNDYTAHAVFGSVAWQFR